MIEKKSVSFIKYAMILTNIIAIFTIAGFVYFTTCRICDDYTSRSFVDGVTAIPWRPGITIVYLAFLIGALILSFVIRDFLYPDDIRITNISIVVDCILGLVIVYLLNFNYSGVLLWIFANIISHSKRGWGQMIFMFGAIFCFLCTDYGIVSIYLNLYNIQDYIGYFNANMQPYLLAVYNGMIAVNIILFILFCISVIQEQRGTIEEVNDLYSKLSLANESLQEANVELQKYAVMKEKMGETKERNRLAREIHDTLGHTLTGISAGIDACLATIDYSPDSTKQQLEVISQVTRDGIGEIRRSVNELRPDALERLSLEYAIRKMIKNTNSLTHTNIVFDCQMENLKFDEDEENAIYRVIQESVTNAIRHGNASNIIITMKKENGVIHISVKDDGTGCEIMKPGFGTGHIKERIEMLHGTVTFDGSDGFLVDAVIPIRWGEEYD